MSYDNTNTGVLFKNDRKKTEKHPDYTGSVTLEDGEERWLSAWIKQGKKGTFMSLSIGDVKGERKQQKQERPQYDDPTDDIPF